jgi:hypothetical protein
MYYNTDSEELHFLKVFKQVLINKGFVTDDDFIQAENQLHDRHIEFIKQAQEMINDFVKEYGDEE